jgi:hypothetical protein
MKIAFCRWVCVDGVVPVRDHLGPQNPDCGTASRFYRRGVAFRFRNRRAASRLPYSRVSAMATRNDRHDPCAIGIYKPCKRRRSIVELNSAYQHRFPVVRHVMESLTPPKSCISQAGTGTGEVRFHGATSDSHRNYMNTTGQGRRQRARILLHSRSAAPAWLAPFLINGKKCRSPGRGKTFVRKTQSKQYLNTGQARRPAAKRGPSYRVESSTAQPVKANAAMKTCLSPPFSADRILGRIARSAKRTTSDRATQPSLVNRDPP